MSAQPALAWSVSSGAGTIGAASGLYTAPNAAGSATVKAQERGLFGQRECEHPGAADYEHDRGVLTRFILEHGLPGQHHDHEHGDDDDYRTGRSQFNFAATITQIWNATVVSHSGIHYVLQNAGYNSTIGPGQSVSFGFLGSPGGAPVAPSNYRCQRHNEQQDGASRQRQLVGTGHVCRCE